MPSITELAVEFTGDTSGLETAALRAARLIEETVASFRGLVPSALEAGPLAALTRALPALPAQGPPAGGLLQALAGAASVSPPGVPSAALRPPAAAGGMPPAAPINLSPSITNKFELTIQTDLEDPVKTAGRIADALDLVFTRKTGMSIVEALRRVRLDLAERGA